MSKALIKTPPPVKPSGLRQRAMNTTILTPFGLSASRIDLALVLAADASGISFGGPSQ